MRWGLAPARLLNTLALFFLVHLAFVRWPRLFVWPPLALLGRHSLAVFSAHVATAYVLFAFPQYVSSTLAQAWLGTAIMLAVLFGVALLSEPKQVKWTPKVGQDGSLIQTQNNDPNVKETTSAQSRSESQSWS